MKRIALTFILLFTLISCSPRCDNDSCKHVLFIGNSYTFVNDLPATLTALTESGGHQIETGMAAEGGWTLTNHANSSDTINKITSSQWDFVVLQEQSEIPSMTQFRTDQMYPAARELVRKIELAGANPIFFITWAHRDGWPENGLSTYESMQSQINYGYMHISRELGTRTAPVGFAWAKTRIQNPEINLWQNDGSHPSMEGTYLAACVFYAVIFDQSPVGLSYRGSLAKETAQTLQNIAAETVLTDPAQWNLP